GHGLGVGGKGDEAALADAIAQGGARASVGAVSALVQTHPAAVERRDQPGAGAPQRLHPLGLEPERQQARARASLPDLLENQVEIVDLHQEVEIGHGITGWSSAASAAAPFASSRRERW